MGDQHRQAQSQSILDGDGDDGSLAAKQTIARFYCEQILPTANGLLGAVLATAHRLFELSNEALTA